jgi:hypothetical protein
MRLHLSRVKLFFALFEVILAVAFVGCSLLPGEGDNNQSHPQATVTPTSNVITQENARRGTNDWEIPDAKGSSIQIQAYASATSVSPGQSLTFYVSTQKEGISYSINIYRLGWYGGLGGRLMTSIAKQTGFAQGYYDQFQHRLVGCSSCLVDKNTGLVEAQWLPSSKFTVPSNWVSGVYLAKFIDANGMQTYVPFDVQGNLDSPYVAVTSTTTYAAYNDWGGYSLYRAFGNGEEPGNDGTATLGRGVKVSFDRPYTRGFGSGDLLLFELDAIRWLERQGYDLSYISSVDLHKNPAQLLHHRVYLSLGHDEYWTREMRDGVENARDHGIGLAFLGADAAYWQMRFEADSSGTPDRTIVCYKVETKLHDLAQDPFYMKDNTRVTSQWRDPVINRPENALIGIMYSSLTQQQRGFPWEVDSTTKSSFLSGTGLQPGLQYGCGLVGYEWDRIFPNGATPTGLQVIGTSPTIDDNNLPDTSNTTYYVASSGAMVFATGSIYWAAALDSYRFRTSQRDVCDSQTVVVPGMQTLMIHVMTALLVRHSQP